MKCEFILIANRPHLTQFSKKKNLSHSRSILYLFWRNALRCKNSSGKHFKILQKVIVKPFLVTVANWREKEGKHFYILLIKTFHIFTLHPFILVFCSLVFKHTRNPSFYIFRYVHIHSMLSFYKRKFTSKLFWREKTYQMWTFFLLFTLASESILPGQELQIKCQYAAAIYGG